VLAQELDVYEPTLNKWVGSLQVLFTNEGKKAADGFAKSAASFETQLNRERMPASAPSATPKQKKVYSKPIAGSE
jgi:hypothetical protein